MTSLKALATRYLKAADLAAWETATDEELANETSTWNTLRVAWGASGRTEPLTSYVRRLELAGDWQS